jgi:hypothetical protein
MLVQVRDLGGRLEHVVAQYDRLVRELLREEALPSGFNSHIHLVNREIGLVTRRLQDLIVQQYETRRNQELRSTDGADRRRRKPREVPMPRAVDRSSVVRPFIPAAQRHHQPMVAEPTRFAAAR